MRPLTFFLVSTSFVGGILASLYGPSLIGAGHSRQIASPDLAAAETTGSVKPVRPEAAPAEEAQRSVVAAGPAAPESVADGARDGEAGTGGCITAAWPYLRPGCQEGEAAGAAGRPVRVISLDRGPSAQVAAAPSTAETTEPVAPASGPVAMLPPTRPAELNLAPADAAAVGSVRPEAAPALSRWTRLSEGALAARDGGEAPAPVAPAPVVVAKAPAATPSVAPKGADTIRVADQPPAPDVARLTSLLNKPATAQPVAPQPVASPPVAAKPVASPDVKVAALPPAPKGDEITAQLRQGETAPSPPPSQASSPSAAPKPAEPVRTAALPAPEPDAPVRPARSLWRTPASAAAPDRAGSEAAQQRPQPTPRAAALPRASSPEAEAPPRRAAAVAPVPTRTEKVAAHRAEPPRPRGSDQRLAGARQARVAHRAVAEKRLDEDAPPRRAAVRVARERPAAERPWNRTTVTYSYRGGDGRDYAWSEPPRVTYGRQGWDQDDAPPPPAQRYTVERRPQPGSILGWLDR